MNTYTLSGKRNGISDMSSNPRRHCISLTANALGKGKIIRQTGFFKLGLVYIYIYIYI